MAFKLATWNINSVRLRMPLIKQFVDKFDPDIICLQETKCRDSEFPKNDFDQLGYTHLAINGQKGYHGVCIASRFPFQQIERKSFCDKGDARHISVEIAAGTALPNAVTLHNFYVPAGGDEPDPLVNEKFAHKLLFLREVSAWMEANSCAAEHAIVVGDLNIAPLQNDVWNHKAMLKIVSHTPVETELLEKMLSSGPWVDSIRQFAEPDEKLFTWWSYRSPNWSEANKGRRLDHVWTSKKLAPSVTGMKIIRDARSWDRPSDHVPVIVNFM